MSSLTIIFRQEIRTFVFEDHSFVLEVRRCPDEDWRYLGGKAGIRKSAIGRLSQKNVLRQAARKGVLVIPEPLREEWVSLSKNPFAWGTIFECDPSRCIERKFVRGDHNPVIMDSCIANAIQFSFTGACEQSILQEDNEPCLSITRIFKAHLTRKGIDSLLKYPGFRKAETAQLVRIRQTNSESFMTSREALTVAFP